MALVDDLKAPLKEHEMNRRGALVKISGGAFTVACGGALIISEQFMRPNVLFEPATKFRVGRPEEIAPGSAVLLKKRKLMVVRDDTGFFAMSTVCTHLGCTTRYQSEERTITCPCHGSQFDMTGKVTGGPAPRPLDRFQMAVENGHLVVDTRKPVAADAVLKV